MLIFSVSFHFYHVPEGNSLKILLLYMPPIIAPVSWRPVSSCCCAYCRSGDQDKLQGAVAFATEPVPREIKTTVVARSASPTDCKSQTPFPCWGGFKGHAWGLAASHC